MIESLGTLVLEVAQSCNLGCTYCYAEGGTYGGTPRLLDPELARRAARVISVVAATVATRPTISMVVNTGLRIETPLNPLMFSFCISLISPPRPGARGLPAPAASHGA